MAGEEHQRSQTGLRREALQAIANSLIASPQFQETVASIVNGSNNTRQERTQQQPVSRPSSRQEGTQQQQGPRGTASSSNSLTHPYSRARNFATPEEELSTLFNNRSRSSPATATPFPAFSNNRPNRPHHSRSGINVRRSRAQTRNTTPYIIKEVVLLDDSKEHKVLRAPKKAQLMEKGFVYHDVQLDRSLNAYQVYELFEELFKSQLSSISWHENEKKFRIMAGVGQALIGPCLASGQELNADTLHRQFGHKIVWLVPTKSLEEHARTEQCLNCGEMIVISEGDTHNQVCNGGGSSSGQRTIPTFFRANNMGLSEDFEAESVTFQPNEEIPFNNSSAETRNTLAAMFPEIPAARLDAVLQTLTTWGSAIDMLTDKPRIQEDLKNAEDVIRQFQQSVISDSNTTYFLTVRREHLFRDGIRFYKLAAAQKELLFRPLLVEFEGEQGVDGGALKIEFFSKLFDQMKREMFEETPTGSLIPKRSGWNLQLFKTVGIAIGHSLLHNGPSFNGLSKWSYAVLAEKDENCIVGLLSANPFKETIPLNAGTASLISLLNELEQLKSDEEINKVFDSSADGPAYEQLVNSSQWPIDCTVTMENLETLKAMLVWEELFDKRERQLKAVREGLQHVGLLSYIIDHPDLMSAFFEVPQYELTPVLLHSIIEWDSVESTENREVLQWLRRYIDQSDKEHLLMLLKFATGHSSLKPMNSPNILLGFTGKEKVFPEAVACANTLMIPLGNCNEVGFIQKMNIALECESEGFGNL